MRRRRARRFNPERIVALRHRLHLSRAGFARRIGFTAEHQRLIEAGRSGPSQDYLTRTADEFRVDVRDFFTP